MSNIELSDFCSQYGITDVAMREISLKSYLEFYIDEFDPLYSFTPIQIKAEAGCIRVVKSNIKCDERILGILNKHHNFSFVTRTLKIKYDHNKSYYYSKGYDGFWGNDFILPLDLLTETDGVDFDFCYERFNKGTMKSVALLDESIEHIDFYLDKVQEFINKVGYQLDW